MEKPEVSRVLKLLDHQPFMRTILVLFFAISFGVLAAGDIVSITEDRNDPVNKFDGPENVTVVTSQGPVRYGAESGLHAYENGELVYYESRHQDYWDVDPAEGNWTVSYVADDILSKQECDASMACVRMVVEKLNMRTGERKTVYSHLNPIPRRKIENGYSSRWHDVDLVGDTGVLVADIYDNTVYLFNTSTGMKEWEWDAQADFETSSGGHFPGDWTHVNDVEMLENGLVTASLRNQDQVVFIDPKEGLQRKMTLGEDGNTEILAAQHNPDYIPRENGGPALLVADSGNDRAIEYQFRNGSWEQTWVWEAPGYNWGRDADRLPNGHTLISDTNGNRVMEVNQEGEIISTIKVHGPYEAERLGTPDESGGGPSAARAGLKSRHLKPGQNQDSGLSPTRILRTILYAPLPEKVVDGIKFAKPAWMGIYDQVALLGALSSLLMWTGLELRWSRLILRSPVTRKQPGRQET